MPQAGRRLAPLSITCQAAPAVGGLVQTALGRVAPQIRARRHRRCRPERGSTMILEMRSELAGRRASRSRRSRGLIDAIAIDTLLRVSSSRCPTQTFFGLEGSSAIAPIAAPAAHQEYRFESVPPSADFHTPPLAARRNRVILPDAAV